MYQTTSKIFHKGTQIANNKQYINSSGCQTLVTCAMPISNIKQFSAITNNLVCYFGSLPSRISVVWKREIDAPLTHTQYILQSPLHQPLLSQILTHNIECSGSLCQSSATRRSLISTYPCLSLSPGGIWNDPSFTDYVST